MKNKILIVLLVLMLIAYPMAAYAVDPTYDETSAAAFTINFISYTITAFSYHQYGTGPMNFNGTRNEKNVTPDDIDYSINPWAEITNKGEDYQNFVARLDSNNPPGFELLIGNDIDDANKIVVENMVVMTTEARSPPHWTNVAPDGKVSLYAIANFNGAPSGVVTKTLKVGLPPEVKSISVTPKTATIYDTDTQQFAATALDQYDMAIGVTWSNENMNIGTISSSGLYTPKAVGLDTITAAAGSKTDTATVEVQSASSD